MSALTTEQIYKQITTQNDHNRIHFSHFRCFCRLANQTVTSSIFYLIFGFSLKQKTFYEATKEPFSVLIRHFLQCLDRNIIYEREICIYSSTLFVTIIFSTYVRKLIIICFHLSIHLSVVT